MFSYSPRGSALSLFFLSGILGLGSCAAPKPQAHPPSQASPSTLEDLLLPPGLPVFSLPSGTPPAPARTLLAGTDPASSKAMEAWKALRALGREGGPALVLLLQEGTPQVKMAAATLLGCLDQRSLLPLCRALGDPDPEVAAAGAFALGDLGCSQAAPRLLLEVLPAPTRSAPLVRAAAASSLLELGAPWGVPFLLGLLQAGCPGNGPLAKAFHLPEKERWALEKEIGLRALRRLSGKRFGLEPEQGWKDLRKGAQKWEAWWKEEKAKVLSRTSPKALQALRSALARLEKALPNLSPGERTRARAWIRETRRILEEGKGVE